MGLAILQSRGQLTVPREERKKAELSPGDTCLVYSEGKNRIVLRVIPGIDSMEDFFERYQTSGKITEEEIDEHISTQFKEQTTKDYHEE